VSSAQGLMTARGARNEAGERTLRDQTVAPRRPMADLYVLGGSLKI
jgi:hypothetical protein